MVDAIYDSFAEDVAKNNIDLDTDTFYIMLVTSSYTQSDAHSKRSNITNEVTGTGYTAGGKTIGTPTVTKSGNITTFDAPDVTWATSTITARGAVIYKSRGGASSADELVCFLDFLSDKTSTAGDFTVSFNASGIITFTS